MDAQFKEIGLREGFAVLRSLNMKAVPERNQDHKIMRHYLAEVVGEPLRSGLLRLYDDFPYLAEVCAGARHHHWWRGGLNAHCCEMIGLGLDLKVLYHRDLQWLTKDDLITAVFLHDFSKVFMYRYITPEDRDRNPSKFRPQQVFTYQEGATDILDAEHLTAVTLMKYGVPITPKQWSAVVFAEGGFSKAHFGFGGTPTHTGGRVNHENPLAAFVHILDLYSASMLGHELR